MSRIPLALLWLGAIAALPVCTPAQESLATRPPSRLATREDSLSALHAMDDVLRANRTDADAWHRRGVLAWLLSNAEKRTGYMKREANDSLLALADSSLRLATRYDPNSPGYLVDLGRFDLTSNSASVRGRAAGLFERALKIARKRADSLGASRASDEMGMTWWRHYQDRANRHIYSFIIKSLKDRTFLHDPRSIAYFVDRQTIRAASQDWSGQVEYLKAWQYFADALRYEPSNEEALRHTYMALVDRQRWAELEHISRMRVSQDSTDAWAWMVNGLAEHRLGDDTQSTISFANGLRLLPDFERRRFERLSRIFTPKDSAENTHLPESERENLRRMYWLMADPLWATPNNEHRLEFLSRVVYAELLFTLPEFGIHGADTDEGEVFVRYGPPPAVISFPPDPETQNEHRIRVLWWYTADEAFLFDQLPTYGVATLEPDDKREVRRLRDTVPVVWLNVGDRARVDSVDLQATRFRAPGDSGDVFVAARIPVADMVRGIDLARGALQVDFDGYNWRAQSVFRRHDERVISFSHGDSDEIRSWRERMPVGTFLYRVEALQPDAMRGARGASRIELVPGRGFDLSDLLVAGSVTPRAGVAPERWSDLDIVPNLGVVRRGRSFGLLWETYGLQPKDGSDDYDVAIAVSRVKSGGLGGFVARIVGGVAGAVGLSKSGEESVSLSFPRQIPARPIAVDYVTLDMGTAPAGTYRVTVTVTDRNGGQHVSRESLIDVTE